MNTLTNLLDLPQPVVDAGANDPYSSGDADISVTRLISPPQQVALVKDHAEELVEDASDRIWSLLGQAVHTILERAGDGEGRIVEKRYTAEVNGWKVSGQIDIIEGGVLSDYKVMSVWEIIHGLKPEKTQQLNVLKYLAQKNGEEVNGLQIVGIFRDWSASKAEHDRDFPQKQIAVLPVQMWPDDKTEKFISERVDLHRRAQAGENIPCTDEERWSRPDKWAVIKVGRKSASRVLDSEEDAKRWRDENSTESNVAHRAKIVHRPGKNLRCESYCAAKTWCSQFESLNRREK